VPPVGDLRKQQLGARPRGLDLALARVDAKEAGGTGVEGAAPDALGRAARAVAAGREHRLEKALAPVRDRYDIVVIDCPPALNILTVNALTAADSVLIPMQCEYYALEGLSGLMSTIEQIRDSVNPKLEVEGILRTMFDPRNNLSNDVAAQLIEHFGDRVFRTIIPRNVRLAEAPSFGVPAMLHDKDSRGALAYLALAGEMIRRDDPDALPLEEPAAEAPAEAAPVVAAAEPEPEASPEPEADETPRYPPPAIPYLGN